MQTHSSSDTPARRSAAFEFSFACANPPGLLDELCRLKRLRNDAELCRLLGVHAPTISKVRTGKMQVSAALLLRIHEVFGLPVVELRRMLAR